MADRVFDVLSPITGDSARAILIESLPVKDGADRGAAVSGDGRPA
jgi:hypothetical protein